MNIGDFNTNFITVSYEILKLFINPINKIFVNNILDYKIYLYNKNLFYNICHNNK